MKNSLPACHLFAPFHLTSRGESQQATRVWLNPDRSGRQRYFSVFILAITGNRAARKIVETDLAAAAAARRLTAKRSIDFFPLGLTGKGGASKEELWTRIQTLGCDAIFTLSLLNVKNGEKCVREGNPFVPYPENSYYGGFDQYVGHVVPVISRPGYYATAKSFFLEGNVFDTATGAIEWSMQSIAYDPSDLECFSKEFALLLVDQLDQMKRLQP